MVNGCVEEAPVGEVALGIDNLVRCVRGGDRHPISGPHEVTFPLLRHGTQ